MSASIISNSLYRFIQDIEDIYISFAKNNPKATYQSFYDYLTDNKAGDAERDTLREYITMKLMDVCYKIKKIQNVEDEVSGNRQDSLDLLRGTFIFIYVVLTIIFIVVCVLVGKAYKHDFYKASKMVLTFVIIYLVVSTLFIVFVKYINYQKRTITANFNELMKSIRSYKQFMHNNKKTDGSSINAIASGDDYLNAMTVYKDKRKNKKKKTDELLKEDRAFATKVWSKYVSPVMQNVHNYGNGLKNLKIIEVTSTNIKILKNVNNVLSPYYDLMLKSRQNFADASTKEGIMNILSATIVKELSNVDVFSLDDNDVLKDPVFISKMEDGEHYKMLMKGFMHLIIYLYPVYKNVSYEKLILLQKEEEAVKNNVKKASELNDEDKKLVNKAMLDDPVLTQVRNIYPLVKDNFTEEIELMKQYDQSDATKDRVEVIQNFVSDTVLAFGTINDIENDKYLRMMNNTPSPSETQILMTNYAKAFHAYFEKLYKNFIRLEFAKLDPQSTQYFIFNPVYMKDKLNTYVKALPVVRDLEPNFTKMMINIIVDDLVSEQKSRYVSSFFSYEKEKDKSLKAYMVNTKMVELIQRVAPALVPYEFKVSDYAKFIIGKLTNNSDNVSSSVSSAIETLLTNIDYEVSIQRGLSTSTLSDAANEMRYVASHDFVYNLDQYKFNTLYNALKPETLKQLVNTIEPESSKVFASREFNRQIAETIMKMLIVILVASYTLYVIMMVEKLQINGNVFADGSSNVSKLNTLLDGDNIWGNVFKFGVPLTGCILFISIFRSYVVKAKDNIEFNKGLMRENTEDIQQSVDELNKILESIGMNLKTEQATQSIGNIKEINIETKQKLYKTIKNILTTYDKCNYIVGIDNYAIPFPYAEVLTDGCMSVFILGLILYSIRKFSPLLRVVELKDLYEYKESSQTLVNDQTFVAEIMTKAACHKDEVDGVMYTVKAIATMAVLVFMVMYSLQIVNSTSEYKGGLYKSPLYENKKCAS
jgi:hypothetical protein